jgi:hypothetical protein
LFGVCKASEKSKAYSVERTVFIRGNAEAIRLMKSNENG